ncbi:amidohydrolase family protein [Nocardia wallacei]|uniref:amidohydrolase family protein n=1 Tax=Nocardia wallacei TaxID=480035 RepID=UPI002454DCBB|nr:amidohydrolase family protein [Nocardia wallacei]
MPSRQVGFPVFDADNHMYETRDALTKYLPERAENTVRYVDLDGRTKIVVRNMISEFIPNPTFSVVAKPGAQEDYFRHGNPEGKSSREIMGEPMKSIPAFREPAARLAKMDELGIDYALMFPTLASLVEERLKDDPELTHDVIHALNQWMHEQWTFDYEGRIFAVPVITLPIVDRALEELEWCLERGARTVLVRPAPVPGFKGSRSFGLEEFDPFWKACVQAGIPVSMHASDSGYSEVLNIWEPAAEYKPFIPTAFRTAALGSRAIEDAMTALTCHGALSRVPDLKVVLIENGADWLPTLFHNLEHAYAKLPQLFLENPVEAFKRCVYVNPFWEDNYADVVELLGADHVIFGSDWPHPEGLQDPLSLLDHFDGISEGDVRKIMGGNMLRLLGLDSKVAAGSWAETKGRS